MTSPQRIPTMGCVWTILRNRYGDTLKSSDAGCRWVKKRTRRTHWDRNVLSSYSFRTHTGGVNIVYFRS